MSEGIMMWGNPIYVEERNIHVLLLDCEGMGSPKNTLAYDSKLFALTFLLSSCMVINSMQMFDEKGLNQLALISDLPKYISMVPPTPGET